jgi:hypothetical protein
MNNPGYFIYRIFLFRKARKADSVVRQPVHRVVVDHDPFKRRSARDRQS